MAETPTTQKCGHCKIARDLSCFSPSRESVAGIRTICKPCIAKQARGYRERSLATRQALRATADLMEILRRPETQERFWSKVSIGSPDECWPWRASTHRGYGSFDVAWRNQKAHRISWQITNDRLLPENAVACHDCDNPTCVNPSHITPDTPSTNTRDAISRGLFKPDPTALHRARAAMTHCKRGHAYDGTNLILRKDGGRDCRACRAVTRAERITLYGQPKRNRRKCGLDV